MIMILMCKVINDDDNDMTSNYWNDIINDINNGIDW